MITIFTDLLPSRILLIEKTIQAQTDLESKIIKHPEWMEGVFWGKPRYGHPEGLVLWHIQEVFQNINKLNAPSYLTHKLRLIALIHDSFKHLEDRSTPRNWYKHHAILGRIFAEQFIDDPGILDIIELHDEAYHCWRGSSCPFTGLDSNLRFDRLLHRIDHNLELYYLFFKCDTHTGDKNLESVKWLEHKIKDKIGLIHI